MTKKTKLLQAIKQGKVKTEKDLVDFIVSEKQREALIKEVIAEIPEVKPIPGPKGERGEPGKDGKTIVGPKGRDGKDGQTPDIKPIIATATKQAIEAVKPLIPDIQDIENELPQLGSEIRDALELLTGKEKLDRSAIYGLEDYEEVSKLAKQPRGVGGSPAGALRMDGTNSPMANINWGGYKITNLATPTSDYDAATKKYVDDAVGAENLWDRTGTTLSPHTANDSLASINDVSATSFTIGANTLSTTEWAYLDGQNQAVKTTSSPTFANINATGYITSDNFTDSSHYTGFPNRTDTSLSWDDATYTLTLTASTDFIWINGTQYSINTLTKQLSVAQEAVSGLYWFWLTDATTLNASTVHPGFDKCLVASVYWNTTTNKGILCDERHWFGRDRWWHEYTHETIGARYAGGLTGTFTDTTFDTTEGEFYDEDIEHNVTAQTTCKVLYHDGSAEWKWDETTTPYKAVAGVLQYDNGTTLTAVDNSKFVNSWVFVTGDTSHPIHIVIGTSQYLTLALARAASVPSFGALPDAETKLIYKVTYQNSGGTPDYIESTDYRSASSLPTTNYVPTDHGSLTGLSDDDHPQYYLADGTRAISSLTASKVVFTDADKKLTSTGIGLSSQFIKGDGSLDSSTYLTAEADTLDTVAGRGATTDVALTFEANATFGKNGVGGAEGIITLNNGANPGTSATISYTKWADLEAVNGLVKCNGSGNYSAITDNSTNWNTAYGWGNHASAGYLTAETDPEWSAEKADYLLIDDAVLQYQPIHANLTSLAGLSYVSASFVKMTAAGTFTLDTNTYITNTADIIKDTHIDWGTGDGQVSTADIPEQTNLYYTNERVDDRVGASLIQNGTGITWSYNDSAGTLTPTVTITQYTDELAQDAVGGILDNGTIGDVNFTYDDATPKISGVVKNGAITYAKMQDVSTNQRILGRSTAGAGDVEEIACTTFAMSFLDDSNEASFKQTVNLEIGVDVQAYHANLASLAGLTYASDSVVKMTGAGTFALDTTAYYKAGGTDVAIGDGGTGASLSDPGADRIMFWDESANAVTWLTCGNSVAITTTTLDTIQDIRTTANPTFVGANFTGWSPSGNAFHAGMVGGAGTLLSYNYTGLAYFGMVFDASNYIWDISGTALLTLDTSGNLDPRTAGSQSLGNGTYYWNDVSYKTLTDRGCLGWFDEGVELQDGRIVSDIEAIMSIKKDPVKTTIYGKPMLDYKSMPKVVYKQATDSNGNLCERDENDNPKPITVNEKDVHGNTHTRQVQPADGAETTALISIMLGAIKELNIKLSALEAKINA